MGSETSPSLRFKVLTSDHYTLCKGIKIVLEKLGIQLKKNIAALLLILTLTDLKVFFKHASNNFIGNRNRNEDVVHRPGFVFLQERETAQVAFIMLPCLSLRKFRKSRCTTRTGILKENKNPFCFLIAKH